MKYIDTEEVKSFGWINEHALWGPISQIMATLAQSFPELTPTIIVSTGMELVEQPLRAGKAGSSQYKLLKY